MLRLRIFPCFVEFLWSASFKRHFLSTKLSVGEISCRMKFPDMTLKKFPDIEEISRRPRNFPTKTKFSDNETFCRRRKFLSTKKFPDDESSCWRKFLSNKISCRRNFPTTKLSVDEMMNLPTTKLSVDEKNFPTAKLSGDETISRQRNFLSTKKFPDDDETFCRRKIFPDDEISCWKKFLSNEISCRRNFPTTKLSVDEKNFPTTTKLSVDEKISRQRNFLSTKKISQRQNFLLTKLPAEEISSIRSPVDETFCRLKFPDGRNFPTMKISVDVIFCWRIQFPDDDETFCLRKKFS